MPPLQHHYAQWWLTPIRLRQTMVRLSRSAGNTHHRAKPQVSARSQEEWREKQKKLTGVINSARAQYFETADGLASEYGR
jgi:hypothetical protein